MYSGAPRLGTTRYSRGVNRGKVNLLLPRASYVCVGWGGGGVGVGVGGCAGVCLRLRPPGPLFFSWQGLFGPRPLPSPFPKCL